MTRKQATARRGLKGLVAVIVGFAAAWAAGPEAVDIVGKEAQAFIVAVVVPSLLALNKYWNYTE